VQVTEEEPSYKAKIAQDEVPVDLDACLNMFARSETLDHGDRWCVRFLGCGASSGVTGRGAGTAPCVPSCGR
jgi:hypothetical protein